MATKYEAEIRIFIEDINKFEEKLKSLGGSIKEEYSFNDTYYKPKNKEWDPNKKNIRLREWINPKKFENLIYFSKTEFLKKSGMTLKRSLLKDGKLSLYKGDKKTAEELLNDLGFVKWFTINKKNCKVWSIKKLNIELVTEYVDEIGYTAELELDGTDIKKSSIELKKIIDNLDVKNYTFKPMSTLYLESIKNNIFKS